MLRFPIEYQHFSSEITGHYLPKGSSKSCARTPLLTLRVRSGYKLRMQNPNPFYRSICALLVFSLAAPNAFSSDSTTDEVVVVEEASDEQVRQNIETMAAEVEKMSDQELKEKLEIRSNELEKLVAEGKLSAEDSEKTLFIAEAMKQASKKPSKFKTKMKSGLKKLGKGAKFGAVLLSVASRPILQTAVSPTTIFLSFIYGVASKKVDVKGTEWSQVVDSNGYAFFVMMQFLVLPNPASIILGYTLVASSVFSSIGQYAICDNEKDKANPEMRILRLCDAGSKAEKAVIRVAAVIGSSIGVGTHYVVLSPYYGVKALVKVIKKGSAKRKARKTPVPAAVAPVMP